jgi:Type II secretion system (T2SS), protein F
MAEADRAGFDMSSGHLAIGWFACVMVAGWRFRPGVLAKDLLRPFRVSRHSVAIHHRLFGAIGRKLILVISALLPARVGADFAARVSEFDCGRIAVVLVVLGAVSPLLSLVYLFWSIAQLRRRARLGTQLRIAAIRRELSLLIDVLRVAVSAGTSLQHAIVLVCDGSRSDGELAASLLDAVQGINRGERFVDSLNRIGNDEVIGQEVRLFVATLLSAEQFGTPLGASLGQLAEDVRDVRRRLAETEARRVPVRMLAPLVLLLLPSFALLTIAPLLASGLGSLRLN